MLNVNNIVIAHVSRLGSTVTRFRRRYSALVTEDILKTYSIDPCDVDTVALVGYYLSNRLNVDEMIHTYAFNIEGILSNKIMSILSRNRFKQSKDLYDFYVITNIHDFSLSKLKSCILENTTFEDLFSTVPLNDIEIQEYREAFNNLHLEPVRGESLPSVSYEKAIERVSDVLTKVKLCTSTSIDTWYAGKGWLR